MVRGAYWNSEKNDGSLFKEKIKTDLNYNEGVIYLSDKSNYCYNILATHNKESIYLGVLLNKIYNEKIFSFAHLLGMRKYI